MFDTGINIGFTYWRTEPQGLGGRTRMATIKQLRKALAEIPAAHDDKEVEVWLPGSYIKLNQKCFLSGRNSYIIEGNLKPGSALEAQ